MVLRFWRQGSLLLLSIGWFGLLNNWDPANLLCKINHLDIKICAVCAGNKKYFSIRTYLNGSAHRIRTESGDNFGVIAFQVFTNHDLTSVGYLTHIHQPR